MNAHAWSAVLQWSRVGGNALLFLAAARYLSLAEIGAFAAVFAPVRLLQVVHRPGLGDAAISAPGADLGRNPLFVLSLGLGLAMAAGLLLAACTLQPPLSPMLAALAALPLLNGLSAPAEAQLRRSLRIKALALRSIAALAFAGALTVWALAAGAGAWSLVVFTLVNTAMGTAIALVLAPPWPNALPARQDVLQLAAAAGRIALRELGGSAALPVLQLTVSLCLGLSAGGAFQIAMRFLALLDAIAIAPLRYVALPGLARALAHSGLSSALLKNLRLTAMAACLVYAGAYAAAPELLVIAAGPEHASRVLPLMPAICLLGVFSALAMPLTQAFTAAGQLALPLLRAWAVLLLSLLLALPGLSHSLPMATAALPLASGLVLLPYTRAALRVFDLSWREITGCLCPPVLAAGVLVLALTLGFSEPVRSSGIQTLAAKTAAGTAIYAACIALLAFPRRRRLQP